jgi:hypothetical protein
MQIGSVGQNNAGLTAANGPSAASLRDQLLRKNVDEFVGMAFYSPMLKTMHNSTIKGDFGHGGRGEEVFQGQLDMELASRAGKATQSSLSEAIYSRMKRVTDAQHGTTPQVAELNRGEDLLERLAGLNAIGSGGLS